MPEVVPGIDRDPDKQGGEPCVAGTRVPVRRVGHLVERRGDDPTEVAERYGISLGDVHRALAYYYDHPDEMQRYDRRDRDRAPDETTTDAETFEEARDRLQQDS